MGHTLHALTYVSLLYPKTAMTRSADLSEEFVRLGMVSGAINYPLNLKCCGMANTTHQTNKLEYVVTFLVSTDCHVTSM
jgi:hypothetical protein